MFLLLYWFLYSPYDIPFNKENAVSKTVDEQDEEPQRSPEETSTLLSSLPLSSSRPPLPYTYFFGKTESDRLTLSASYGGSWTFSVNDRYNFDGIRNQIRESDDCFGKPNGYKLEVRGKTLYDYIIKKKLINGLFRIPTSSSESAPRDLIAHDTLEYIRKRYDFYFQCRHDTVHQLYACPPGTAFRDGNCHAIDSCVDRENGFVIADPADRRYYRVCLNERPVRKRCQPETFFLMDTCRSLDSEENNSFLSEMCESENFVFPIHKKKYIQCILNGKDDSGRPKYRAVVKECSENMSLLEPWKTCERDDCVGMPDSFKKPMATITRGPFVYSPGFYVCRENRIVETIQCPSEWNHGTSRGDNLTRLPTVFDTGRQTCSVPSFCENVFSAPGANVIVPVHEFTKHVPKWKYAAFFDSVAGYQCTPKGREEEVKTRFVLEPGKRIIGNTVLSACDRDSKIHIPIGDRFDAYYDCKSQKVIKCGPDSFFDGETCQKSIMYAHSYKNIPFFRLTGLSHRNDWMEPFRSKLIPSTACLKEQEGLTYFPQYDVCSVPECSAYSFLKQMPTGLFFFLPDSNNTCTYHAHSNTIRRKRYDFGLNKKLDFWRQVPVPKTDTISEDDCSSGQKLKSGNFFLDSTIFITCNPQQPFVFCPSASTQGIAQTSDGTYACLSPDTAYEIHVEANETISCLNEQVTSIQIEEKSHYLVDGKKELGSDIRNPSTGARDIFVLASGQTFTFWSDGPYTVRYLKLPTYPPNVHLESNKIVKGTLPSSLKTNEPLDLPHHIVEESIEKEIY